jgi:ABC-type amino acid transport system permease subunit
MDSDKVLEFLKKVADQLGPAGQRAFQIVYQRVLAESVVWVVFGFVVLILSIVIAIFAYRKGSVGGSDDEGWAIVCLVALIIGLPVAAIMIVSNAFNLFSLEYATIERILHLVNPK